MRAMEYTPVQCRCEPMGQWTLVRWCLIHGTQVEPTKKLTDAECAAHYWQTIRDADVQGYSGRRARPKGQCVIREAFTWHRFATQPHASEVEA